jgi:hypothetical protein
MAANDSSVRVEDIDALVSGATPQFSMQIKARLDALTRGIRAPGRPPVDDPGWESIPSHPHGGPLPGDR